MTTPPSPFTCQITSWKNWLNLEMGIIRKSPPVPLPAGHSHTPLCLLVTPTKFQPLILPIVVKSAPISPESEATVAAITEIQTEI